MSIAKITDISRFPLDSQKLWGCHIDRPLPGAESALPAVSIRGWVLSRDVPAVSVEVVSEQVVAKTIPLGVPRDDIAARHPDVAWSRTCGFHANVSLLEMEPAFSFELRAVLADKSRVRLGSISGECRIGSLDSKPILQPLMVTMVWRTGSTWLMRLLAAHPNIVVHRSFIFETRAAQHLLHTLKRLAEPADHLHLTDAEEPTNWLGPLLTRWADQSLATIDEFYQGVAKSQGQRAPVYFAEKFYPDFHPWLAWSLYGQAREIFIVRDFRDMLCSTLSHYEKRGDGHGRQHTNSDEEYALKLQQHVRLLLQSWRARSSRSHLVRYEDLVFQPEDTLQGLLDYLDLDSSPATIQRMMERGSSDPAEPQRHRTSESPTASVGRWKRDMPPSLQRVCEEVFPEILKAFGYVW